MPLPSVRAEAPAERRRVPALARIAAGHGLYAALSWCFDQVLYVWAVYELGMLAGGAMMGAISLLMCAGMLVLYDRMGIDWVGAGELARRAKSAEPGFARAILGFAQGRGKAPAFLALCVLADPFVAAAWSRGGRFGGLARRDWAALLAAGIVSNGYWTLRCGLLAAGIRWMWGGPG